MTSLAFIFLAILIYKHMPEEEPLKSPLTIVLFFAALEQALR